MAAIFFFLVAVSIVWILATPISWKAFYFVESSWTLPGDIAVLFVSVSYGLGLIFIARLWNRLRPQKVPGSN